MEFRLLPSQIEALSPQVIILQRGNSQVFGQNVSGVLEDLHLKRTEKEFTITSFLNKSSKGGQAHSQEESYLNFSQAKGNIKAILITDNHDGSLEI